MRTLPDVFLFCAKFKSKIKDLVDSKARRIRLKSKSNSMKVRIKFEQDLIQFLASSKRHEAPKCTVSARKINGARLQVSLVTACSSFRLERLGRIPGAN
jgi:hypothetical protein